MINARKTTEQRHFSQWKPEGSEGISDNMLRRLRLWHGAIEAGRRFRADTNFVMGCKLLRIARNLWTSTNCYGSLFVFVRARQHVDDAKLLRFESEESECLHDTQCSGDSPTKRRQLLTSQMLGDEDHQVQTAVVLASEEDHHHRWSKGTWYVALRLFRSQRQKPRRKTAPNPKRWCP